MDELTIEKFGEIMDDFIKKNEIHMLMTIPEGSTDVRVQDNTGGGPTMQFYILLNAIEPIAKGMRKLMDIDGASKDWAQVVDALLELVRNALVEGKS